LSVYCQFKIRCIVIYYSGPILITKNNTRQQRGHSSDVINVKQTLPELDLSGFKIVCNASMLNMKDENHFKQPVLKLAYFEFATLGNFVVVVKTLECVHKILPLGRYYTCPLNSRKVIRKKSLNKEIIGSITCSRLLSVNGQVSVSFSSVRDFLRMTDR